MSVEIKKIAPVEVWENFYALTQIPRPSKREAQITAFMENFGKDLGLETIVDKVGNVIIRKPATPGYEDRVGVILQAHLDMVPQKNSDVQHDFEKDPIDAYIDGDVVRARGTTLGADNGIGVAAAMAVLKSKTLKHGPIEGLFTIDEETGMTGAIELSPDILQGGILLNLDSETVGELYVGCAGGLDGTLSIPVAREAIESDRELYRINIKGLKGGHSGMDITLGRGNSIKILLRILHHLEEFDLRLVELEGGSLRNAIPREAYAIVAVPSKAKSDFEKAIALQIKALREEYAEADGALDIACATAKSSEEMLTMDAHRRVVRGLLSVPNGMIRMSDAMPGLVETSTNLAKVLLSQDSVQAQCLLRSSVESAKIALSEQMHAAVALAGGDAKFDNGYPGWNPNMRSPILKAMRETYEKEYGSEPKIMAVHAGLECGILGGAYPNLDMISFGPTIYSPHSPDERVVIDTVAEFWKFLTKVLENSPKR